MVQRLVVLATLFALGGAPAAHSVEVKINGSGEVTIFEAGSEVANVVTVSLSGGNVIVRDTGEAATSSDNSCEPVAPDTRSCNPLMNTPVVKYVGLFGGSDSFTAQGAIRIAELHGGAGSDTITGGDLNDALYGNEDFDTINGGAGPDTMDGGAGADTLDGGAGDDFSYNDVGGDVFRDTGGGNDAVSYFMTSDPAGVEVTFDDVANDGNINQDGGTDNIAAGIEHVQGSAFSDELNGGPGAEFLSGAAGDDTLVGNGGADRFNGAEGNDRIEARDGVADADIDCDNSMGTHGAADVAILDAADPEPRNCETADRAPAGGGGGGGAGGEVAGPPTGASIESAEATEEKSKMPSVVGKELDAARRAVLARVLGVDLDVVFQAGCGQSKDLEVLRQRPAKGTALKSFEGSDVPVRLYVCVAEKNFLGDCTLDGVRSDLRELPKRQDAEMGLTILRKFAKCQVDYDIKLVKRAQEATIRMAAQRDADAKNKRRAEIKAGIDCPTTPTEQDLRMIVTQGFSADPAMQLGLHASDPHIGWTLPVVQTPYRSALDVQVFDRAMQFVNATVYIDAEGVGIEQGGRGTPKSIRLKQGNGRIVVNPQKAGSIRLCAVLETGDDQVLTAAVQIRVAPALKLGEVWETVGGRRLEKVSGGWKDVTDEAVARKAGIVEFFQAIFRAFSGTSQTVNQAAGEQKISARGKVRQVSSRWSAGQITMDGTLEGEPAVPTVEQGECLAAQKAGKVLTLKCSVIVTHANSALIGMSTTGTPVAAFTERNVQVAEDSNVVGPSGGGLIGPDGATLIGPDGATLVGPDGATLIGADGASLAPALAQLIGPDGATLIGPDGATLIGPDGATLKAINGSGLAAPNSLP